ncbi:outer membrane protein assembly factor BamD [Pelagibacterium xiamenense]|uniref:outer membrane protein assembly factor BamD n=1 Tax=Pelagibacterium xiamenense TaxID=2901140 RepID=UPI001E5DB9D6|nr:outer membrane protein assembly factor BamD [Pelagibacterium xiamenense]
MSISARSKTLVASLRLGLAAALVTIVAACSGGGFFSKPEEPIIPADELYSDAVGHMEANRYISAIEDLEKLERQHPYSDYNERAKVMITFANFRLGRYEEAALAADRFLALYPQSSEAPYIIFLKGSSYFQQIPDATRDQTFAADTIDTFELLISSYPTSRYAEEAKPMMVVARDQLAAKEMSVGRYYLGHQDYAAAINRFRAVVEDHQQSTHVEEALYRLVEAYLSLGLASEAQTAAAVLGTNYPASEWYGRAFSLLQDRGLSPQMVAGNWLSR